MLDPLELIATSAAELDEIVAFCRSSDLELLCVIAIAVPSSSPASPAAGGVDQEGDGLSQDLGARRGGRGGPRGMGQSSHRPHARGDRAA